MVHQPFSFVQLPKAIKTIIIFTVSIYLGQWIFPGWLELAGALIPEKTIFSFQIWRVFSYIFLHGSFFHILLNLFMLWSFGKELEYLWGTKEFIKYFFLCGIGAACFNLILDPFSTGRIIGSSGAIYGLLVAFAMNFPNSVIYLYGLIPVRTKHFVILLTAIEFLASFEGSSTIARFAHLGGMATGFAYLKFFSFRSLVDQSYSKLKNSLFTKERLIKRVDIGTEDLTKEVDKILEKVLKTGPGSLTENEREVMRRYSNKKKTN